MSNVVATVTGDCTNDVPEQRAASAAPAAAAAAAAVADAAVDANALPRATQTAVSGRAGQPATPIASPPTAAEVLAVASNAARIYY